MKFKVRVACVVVCNDEFALIQRKTEDGEQWTLPGGNVEEEDIETAIIRELDEELGLTGVKPELLCLQDMLIHRPDKEGLYRKLHIVFRVVIDTATREKLKIVEADDLSDGSVKWIAKASLADLHMYPSINMFLFNLPSLSDPVVPSVLPPLTDETYSWR
jgi:8-oxo-dGTP pyrophosphatase MutT (NUDIX family)